ncbi:splicing factor 3B subunit 1-like [Dorcoceras hygrometricum]|uniref:Splicing factor 3B subunit 1-like n=1 Tax=Dorcoceras hygrometricum TaxID=472368 RepID=A0A2Z7BH45_9LAMI|nr:splicing factor 3B subunit 1-like [Dorcoceras hygrometricum]
MASSLINNAIQVYFDSVLGMEHEGMVAMFESLMLFGLNGFLGCSSAIYEAALMELFHNASVRDGKVVSTVQGKHVAISEELFAGTFELSLEGLTDIHEVPQDLVFEARSVFTYDGKLLSTSCKKREMTFEFRLLNNILAKSVTVKAGSFDTVTHERFLMMSAIHGGTSCYFRRIRGVHFSYDGKLLSTSCKKREMTFEFRLLNDILAKSVTVKAGSFDAVTHERFLMMSAIHGGIQIDSDLVIYRTTLVQTFQVVTICRVDKSEVLVVLISPHDSKLVKRKRTKGRAAPEAKSLALVTVAQEVVPIQMVSAVTPPAPKLKAPKRKLKLPSRWKQILGEPSLTRSDDIIVQITKRSIAVNDEDDNLDGAENEIARKMAYFTAPKQFLKEPLRYGEDDDMSGSKQSSKIIETVEDTEKDKEIEPVTTEDLSLTKSVAMMTDSEDTKPLSKVLELTDKSKSDEDSMSIEDILEQIPEGMMLPSLTAAEITRIKFGLGIEISGVNEGDWYKASLPRIATSDKGKAPLVAKDEIKGNPAREMFSLICADIDFLLQLREKTLQTQMRIHGLKWERICISRLFEGENRDLGAREKIFGYPYHGQLLLANGNFYLNDNTMTLWPRSVNPSRFFENDGLTDIIAVGSVVDLAVDSADFVGVFRRGLYVQVITSDSSSSSSSIQLDLISPNDSFAQRNMDTALTSTNPSISTDSRMFFTTDDIPLGVGTAVDQILMHTAVVTPHDFIEPLEQLRASVNQIQIERVQKRDDAENLKDVLLLHIRGLEQWFTEILEQQDGTFRGLFSHVRQEVQLQKAALSLEVLDSRQKLQT